MRLYDLRRLISTPTTRAAAQPDDENADAERHRRQSKWPVVHRYSTCQCLMPLMKLDRRRSGCGNGCQVRNVVGDRVEHQVDGHAGQVGADTVVRAGAAKSEVRVGISQDVERERVVEDLFVEVRRPVEQHQPLALLDLDAADFGVDQRGALERGDGRGPANDLVGGGLRPLRT